MRLPSHPTHPCFEDPVSFWEFGLLFCMLSSLQTDFSTRHPLQPTRQIYICKVVITFYFYLPDMTVKSLWWAFGVAPNSSATNLVTVLVHLSLNSSQMYHGCRFCQSNFLKVTWYPKFLKKYLILALWAANSSLTVLRLLRLLNKEIGLIKGHMSYAVIGLSIFSWVPSSCVLPLLCRSTELGLLLWWLSLWNFTLTVQVSSTITEGEQSVQTGLWFWTEYPVMKNDSHGPVKSQTRTGWWSVSGTPGIEMTPWTHRQPTPKGTWCQAIPSQDVLRLGPALQSFWMWGVLSGHVRSSIDPPCWVHRSIPRKRSCGQPLGISFIHI